MLSPPASNRQPHPKPQTLNPQPSTGSSQEEAFGQLLLVSAVEVSCCIVFTFYMDCPLVGRRGAMLTAWLLSSLLCMIAMCVRSHQVGPYTLHPKSGTPSPRPETCRPAGRAGYIGGCRPAGRAPDPNPGIIEPCSPAGQRGYIGGRTPKPKAPTWTPVQSLVAVSCLMEEQGRSKRLLQRGSSRLYR